jgi:hypothetical protein
MAPRRKQKRTLKPRLPARVRTKKRKSRTKNAQHPELIGLGLLALESFSRLSTSAEAGWPGLDRRRVHRDDRGRCYVAPIAFSSSAR